MIKSNLSEAYQLRYLSYLTERYKHKWTFDNSRIQLYPVISLHTVETVFGIEVPRGEIIDNKVAHVNLEEQYNIVNPVFNFEQFKDIVYKYRLNNRKSYVDLLVAYELLRYDYYITETLVLLSEDMYNTAQMQKELCDALYVYYTDLDIEMEGEISFDIAVNPMHGICYKELMDYAHYGGAKPNIVFKIRDGNAVRQCVIEAEEYEMNFTEVSYNIIVNNINFL